MRRAGEAFVVNVDSSGAAHESGRDALVEVLRRSRRVVALTGAGCSTASGIPDYRGPNGTWHKRRPMNYAEFIRSAESRRYFWARNYRGWPRFAAAEPNAAHHALASLERRGVVASLITQNVDDLHRRAGHEEVTELHGSSSRVVCLDCGTRSPRAELQERFASMNSGWRGTVTAYNPDADAELDRAATADFVVPECLACGGRLKPDVVFFGESVERSVVDRCMSEILASDTLLVIGSSLTVWSGFRFAKAAHELGHQIVIVNQGETRADSLATLRISAPCESLLSDAAALI